MALKLRLYQEAAVAAVYRHIEQHEDNPCIVIPTAGGKSLVIARICQDVVEKWEGRILVLAHVKELLQQTYDELLLDAPHLKRKIGMYSAGLNRRDTKQPIIIAGIQSVCKRAEELGHFDLVLVDEAHLIPPDGEGRYRRFLEAALGINPRLRVVGLTATPYRMKSGMICNKESILNYICYEARIQPLMEQGYLSMIRSKAGMDKVNDAEIKVRGGDFMLEELEAYMNEEHRVEKACDEIVRYTEDRKAVLIFACGVAHAKAITKYLRQHLFLDAWTVFGDTPSKERDNTVRRFQEGELKYLVNVGVFTTGFNVKHIDAIALLRPTLSPGLFYQMVGRGFRVVEGKKDCLVLDFGGNTMRHGPVDAISVRQSGRKAVNESEAGPVKTCPGCQEIISAGFQQCPECGYEFPDRESEHDAMATDLDILSGDGKEGIEEHEVNNTRFEVWTKKGGDPGGPKTLRVDYSYGIMEVKSEWICLEHDGYARQKAVSWWARRSKAPAPTSAAEAINIIEMGGLRTTLAIRLKFKKGERFPSISDYALGPMPEWEKSETALDDLITDDVEF